MEVLRTSGPCSDSCGA